MHTQNEKINFTAKQPFCIVYSHNDLDISFLLTSCHYGVFFSLLIFVSHVSSFLMLNFTLHVGEKSALRQSVKKLGNFERVDNRIVICSTFSSQVKVHLHW